MSRVVKILLAVALSLGGLLLAYNYMAKQQQQAAIEAVQAFVAPDGFVVVDTSTSTGLNEALSEIEFSSMLSVDDACEQSRHAIAAWAGQDVELKVLAGPRPACSVNLRFVATFLHLDGAAITVFRAAASSAADDFDDSRPGGIDSIRFWVRDPTDWFLRSN